MATKYKSKALSFTTYIDPEIPTYLQGDPGRIGQVLLNLISNAIKFTTAGSIFVEAKLTDETIQNNGKKPFLIQFSVTDTGIGIASSTLPQLFQPFVQGDSSMTRKFGGTGLGLSISKKLVSLMSGEIGVESTEGKGSRFWFTLPLQQGEAPKHDLDRPRTDLHNLKILIVEEDPIARKVLQAYLGSWGIVSDSLGNDSDCLEALQQASDRGRPYDLAFIGQGVNSLTTAKQISQHSVFKKTKIILLADYRQTFSEVEIRNAGVRTCITKPFKQSQIFDSIVSAISNTPSSLQSSDHFSFLAKPEAIPSGSMGRVLVVEDNAINQKVARSMLEKAGYSVFIAANGEEALKQLDVSEYDVILMDCQMPVMDGFEATKTIRQMEDIKKSKIPVIALTANAMKGDSEKCLKAGMNDYISKPIQNEILLQKIQQWAQNKKSPSKIELK